MYLLICTLATHGSTATSIQNHVFTFLSYQSYNVIFLSLSLSFSHFHFVSVICLRFSSTTLCPLLRSHTRTHVRAATNSPSPTTTSLEYRCDTASIPSSRIVYVAAFINHPELFASIAITLPSTDTITPPNLRSSVFRSACPLLSRVVRTLPSFALNNQFVDPKYLIHNLTNRTCLAYLTLMLFVLNQVSLCLFRSQDPILRYVANLPT